MHATACVLPHPGWRPGARRKRHPSHQSGFPEANHILFLSNKSIQEHPSCEGFRLLLEVLQLQLAKFPSRINVSSLRAIESSLCEYYSNMLLTGLVKAFKEMLAQHDSTPKVASGALEALVDSQGLNPVSASQLDLLSLLALLKNRFWDNASSDNKADLFTSCLPLMLKLRAFKHISEMIDFIGKHCNAVGSISSSISPASVTSTPLPAMKQTRIHAQIWSAAAGLVDVRFLNILFTNYSIRWLFNTLMQIHDYDDAFRCYELSVAALRLPLTPITPSDKWLLMVWPPRSCLHRHFKRINGNFAYVEQYGLVCSYDEAHACRDAARSGKLAIQSSRECSSSLCHLQVPAG